MTSSSKKKKEKKKDFQKAKLKVGKTAPKVANHTSTAFKAKSIVLKQQSLSTSAPSVEGVFVHNLSLLTSKSESQRRDALASMTNVVVATNADEDLPQPIAVTLPKLEPIVLDASQSVRVQLLRLLDALGAYDRNRCQRRKGTKATSEFAPHVEKMTLYILAALNHLSSSIRGTGLDVLTWLLTVVPQELVASKGGFSKPLKTLLALLGWSSPAATASGQKASGWTMTKPAPNTNSVTDTKAKVKTLSALAQLLQAALKGPSQDAGATDLAVLCFPSRHAWLHNETPKATSFDHLGLFLPPAARRETAEEGTERLETAEERAGWLRTRYIQALTAGVEVSKKEGGEIGRAAKVVELALCDEVK